MTRLYLQLAWFLFMFILASTAFAEDRTMIAVVDTGINLTTKVKPYLCKSGHKDFTGMGLRDKLGHGSMITDVVVDGLDPTEYCILVVKWFHTTKGTFEKLANAISYADSLGAKILNVSASGATPDQAESEAVWTALNNKRVLVVAAGNEHTDLDTSCDAYPACYAYKNGLFHIVAHYPQGVRSPYTNYGGPVTDTEDGTYFFNGTSWLGTSVAAAKVTNRIARQHAYTKNR